MPIKAVAFDLDGLMFNTEDVFDLSGNELLRRRGLTMTDAIRDAMLGRRAEEAFQNLIDLTGLDESIDALRSEAMDIFFSLLDDHLQPMPGLFDLLDHLETRSLPKAVATSSPRFYLEEILGRYALLSRFPTTLTAEDVTRGKPSPEIYLHAAQRLGVAPSELLVLEDSEAGTRAAAAAGAIIVSIPNRHTAQHNFESASHIAPSLADPLINRLLREI